MRFCTFDERYANPRDWPSSYANGSEEMQEKVREHTAAMLAVWSCAVQDAVLGCVQLQDYEEYYHYVPFDRATNKPIPFAKVKDRIGGITTPFARLWSEGDEVMKWRNEDTNWRICKDGNATDTGLFKFGDAQTSQLYRSHMADPESLLGLNDNGSLLTQYRSDWKQIGGKPFNSYDKFMLTVHEVPHVSADKGELRNKLIAVERKALLDSAGLIDDLKEEYVVLMMKGGGERVVSKCSTTLINGKQIAPKLFNTMSHGRISDERTKCLTVRKICDHDSDPKTMEEYITIAKQLPHTQHDKLMPAGVCDAFETDTEKVFADSDCLTLESWQRCLATEGERIIGNSTDLYKVVQTCTHTCTDLYRFVQTCTDTDVYRQSVHLAHLSQ